MSSAGGFRPPDGPFGVRAAALRLLRQRPPTAFEALEFAAIVLDEYGPKDARVVRTAPKWRAGDVVVVRFSGPSSQPYTYVRGVRDWPGDGTRMTDQEMTRRWLLEQATPVLQQGGEPFDRARLRGSPEMATAGGMLAGVQVSG